MASEAQVRELLEKMAEERGRLLTQVRALSDVDASYRPPDKTGEEGWSAKEQLAHLWSMERTYIAWVQRALEEDGANLTGLPPRFGDITIEAANAHAVTELVQGLVEERARTLDFIRAIDLAGFDRTAVQPMFGQLTVLQWLRSFYRHDRMHSDQIAGRDPTYKPRFISGVEPDQRRR